MGPRRKPETVAEYVFERCNQLNDGLGGYAEIRTSEVADRSQAIIEASVKWEGERLELTVFEHVVPNQAGRPHRRRYKYGVRWRGEQLFRYERDPVNHPEIVEHKHLGSDRRIRSHRVTVGTVVDEMWETVTMRKDQVAARRRLSA